MLQLLQLLQLARVKAKQKGKARSKQSLSLAALLALSSMQTCKGSYMVILRRIFTFSAGRRTHSSQPYAKSSLQTTQLYACRVSCLTSTTMSDSRAVINATQTHTAMELLLLQLISFLVDTASVLASILSSSWVRG